MNIINKRPTCKPTTFADIEIGTLFSRADGRNTIYMKTHPCNIGLIKINCVDLKNGILYRFAPEDEMIPIDNYEFNIF